MMKIVKKKQNIALNTSILLDQTNIDYKRERERKTRVFDFKRIGE